MKRAFGAVRTLVARTHFLYYNENKVVARLPGSSMVEHSAVNRRVASSNLARGANLLLIFQTITATSIS